ncbi:MAG: glycosyltransferase, partial [Pseudomonadota bacterium]
DPVPLYALIRSRWGYILLDADGVRTVLGQITVGGKSIWPLARRVAKGRAVPPLLGWMLRRAGLSGCHYINVGHSNLTLRVLATLRTLNAHIAVLIHDVIPLEFPQYQREGTSAKFAAMLGRVAAHADLIIYNSADTQTRARQHMKRDVPSIVAHLGTDLPAPDPGLEVPSPPYFVCVGTIEPRKNHAFLLDLWDEMGVDAPPLVIAGNRGWNNDAVFARLDALGPGSRIIERNGLSDAQITALIARANGLLFPSFAEGYGLPAVEAAALGTPVVANDLPVYREVLGDIPIYASVSDRYLWINKVRALAETARDEATQKQYMPPTWADHFKTVLRLT